MVKIGKLIDKVIWMRENKWVSYNLFKTKKNFTIELVDALNYTWLPTEEYEMFLIDSRYPNKGLQCFFAYFKDHEKNEHMKETITIEEFEKYFDEMIRAYATKIIDTFLENKDTSKTYESFHIYLLREKSFILDVISNVKIRTMYEKIYQEYLKLHNKNEFGLEFKHIDEQLGKMNSWNGIWDGSFLYSRSTTKSSGIGKYNNAVENKTYKDIKPTENILYESILSEKNIEYAYTVINKSKTIVEIWPGGVTKLLDNLKMLCWDRTQLERFLKNKKIKLLDVAAEWYVGIKNQLNEIVDNVSEGVEGDMTDSESLAYQSDQSCYFMFGGTIGNFTLDEIEKILGNMKSRDPLKSSYVFMTYFTAPNKEKLTEEEYNNAVARVEAMYGGWDKNNPQYNPAMEDFILSWFEALGISRYTTNEKTPQIEYAVKYEEASGHTPARIKLWVKVLSEINIKTTTGKTFYKRAGEYIWWVQSSRFTEEEFKQLAKKSWYDMPIGVDDNWVGVAVLKSKLWINDKYKKTRNIVWWILIWSMLLGWWMMAKNILHKKETQKQQNRIDNEFASNQKISFYGNDHGYYELKTEAEKIKYINTVTDNVFANISIRYNTQTDESEVKKLIRLYIKDKGILWRFSNTNNYKYTIFDIADECAKKYGDIFIEKGINIMPYDHIKEYEGYFNDLILDSTMTNQNVVQIQKSSTTSLRNGYVISPINESLYYDIQLECVKNWIKREIIERKTIQVESGDDVRIKTYIGQSTNIKSYSVKDGYLYVKEWVERPYKYVIATSKDGETRKEVDPMIIAYDYFYQNRPIINEVYKKFWAIYRNQSGNYNREDNSTYWRVKDSIRKLIIRDMLKTWMLDRLPKNNKMIISYLQWFVKRNAIILPKEWISLNPYDDYQKKYTEALENTSKVQGNEIPTQISYEERQKYDFHYIGKFYTEIGEEYDVAEMTIAGVKYLYARNVAEDKDTYHTEEWLDIKILNYYFSRGKEVVESYKKTQKITKETSDGIVKNIHVQPNNFVNSIHTKKPDSRSKGFNPWLVKR